MELTGNRVEVFLTAEGAPKLSGTVMEAMPAGVVLATSDDGTAIKYAVHAVFVPYTAIRYIHLLRERDSAEQEAKKKELEERFRRQTLEALSAHTKEADLLAQTDTD